MHELDHSAFRNALAGLEERFETGDGRPGATAEPVSREREGLEAVSTD